MLSGFPYSREIYRYSRWVAIFEGSLLSEINS